jgi:hypothetical protein
MREGTRQSARETDRHRSKECEGNFSEPHCMFMLASSESYSLSVTPEEEKKKEKKNRD